MQVDQVGLNMTMALAIRHCQTTRTVFGGRMRSIATLVVAMSVACVTISCISPAPAGESVDFSVAEVQLGEVGQGQPVRWGGTITKIHNKAGVTVLEIVSRPLLRSGRPRHNDVTDGRFLAEISSFLDPEIVSPGRDISVIGTITRIDDGLIGEAEYRYPVMSVFDYRFWKEKSDAELNGLDPYYLYSDKYWRNWPHRGRANIHGQIIF